MKVKLLSKYIYKPIHFIIELFLHIIHRLKIIIILYLTYICLNVIMNFIILLCGQILYNIVHVLGSVINFFIHLFDPGFSLKFPILKGFNDAAIGKCDFMKNPITAFFFLPPLSDSLRAINVIAKEVSCIFHYS